MQEQQQMINNRVKHKWRDQKNKQKLMMRNKSSMQYIVVRSFKIGY